MLDLNLLTSERRRPVDLCRPGADGVPLGLRGQTVERNDAYIGGAARKQNLLAVRIYFCDGRRLFRIDIAEDIVGKRRGCDWKSRWRNPRRSISHPTPATPAPVVIV